MLEKIALIASYADNLMRRGRANRILRERYGIMPRPAWRPTGNPAWLSAMD